MSSWNKTKKGKAYMKKYHIEHRQQYKEVRAKARARFFEIYGSRCGCCGQKETRFLTVGHRLNDGHNDRLEKGGQGAVIQHAIKHPDFERYETQCFNCNMGAKNNRGVCPHNTQAAPT